jgi:hypothetical protein
MRLLSSTKIKSSIFRKYPTFEDGFFYVLMNKVVDECLEFLYLVRGKENNARTVKIGEGSRPR